MSKGADTLTVNAEVPLALLPLLDESKRHRYYVLYGGRGSAKSWTVARALILLAMKDPLRILCAREIMNTIKDSVHLLLCDQIKAMGIEEWFTVTDTGIKHIDGAEFIYAGLRALDAAKIKSFEGVDVCWVEEGQAVSKKSWTILVPTIRAPDSEIWVTFNPELDSDDTFRRFVVSPPANAWVKKVSYRDNPWFPAVLEEERLHLEKTDPEEYAHVWDGACRTVVAGAIYGKEMLAMVEDRRICRVPYDPKLPVHTIWDLGWNDKNSIILVQKIHSEVRIIKYLEDSFVTVPQWVAQLQEMKYVWGVDYLPHDGAQTSRQTGKSDRDILEGLGRTVKVIPIGDVEDGIRQTRLMFPRVLIDEVNAERLAECLKKYRRAISTTTNEPMGPVHDEYSHGADAFRGLGVIVEEIRNERDRPRKKGWENARVVDEMVGM